MTGKLIDIGCGIKPYKKILEPYVDLHIGFDYVFSNQTKLDIDFLSSSYNIPVESESFDSILCTDALEHFNEPSLALEESFRILKPGGYAIYTVPLFWHLHEAPNDFFRFTKFGIRYLFEKNKFEIIEIKALSGFILTLAQETVYFLYKFRKKCKLNPLWWIIPAIGFFIQLTAYLLNKIDHSESFTVEYLIVVKKPEKYDSTT